MTEPPRSRPAASIGTPSAPGRLYGGRQRWRQRVRHRNPWPRPWHPPARWPACRICPISTSAPHRCPGPGQRSARLSSRRCGGQHGLGQALRGASTRSGLRIAFVTNRRTPPAFQPTNRLSAGARIRRRRSSERRHRRQSPCAGARPATRTRARTGFSCGDDQDHLRRPGIPSRAARSQPT